MDQLTAMRVFLAVADEGAFAAAARRLGMSTSAVSRHVAELEAHLAATLLHRTTRRLSLTEAGQRYRARVDGVLDQIEAMDAEAGQAACAPRGLLRITAVPVFGEQFLAPVASDFLRCYPEIRLELDLNDRVVDVIAEGFDAAIRSGPLPDSSFRARRLAEPTYVACASPEYLARAGVPERPEDLERHECIHWFYRRPVTRWPFLADGRIISVPVRGRFAVTSALAQRRAVLDGLGIALFLAGIVDEDLRAGRLVQVLEPFQAEPMPISILWPASAAEPLKLRVFIDFLVEALHNAGAPSETPDRSEGRDR